MWSISYVTFVDIIAQFSLTPWLIFLFLHVLTLKLRISIIILLTDWNNSLDCPYNKKLSCLCLIYFPFILSISGFDLTFWNGVVKTTVTSLSFSKFRSFFLSTFNLNHTILIFKVSEHLLNATEVTTCRMAVATFTSKC